MVCSDTNVSGFSLCISIEGDVYTVGKGSHGSNGFEEVVVTPKPIPGLQNIIAIASGENHSIFLNNIGDVFTLGYNNYGQLGISVTEITETYQPQKLELPFIKQIACGDDFNVCSTENGEIYTFGLNSHGQIGDGNTRTYVDCPKKIEQLKDLEFIECGKDNTICKTFEFIYIWGSNSYNQLGVALRSRKTIKPIKIKCTDWIRDENSEIVDIKCGYNHTLVLTSNQEVFCCGNTNLEEDDNRKIRRKLHKIANLSEITRIECGKNYSMCLDANNLLYVFGFNSVGQLGIGNYMYETYDYFYSGQIIDPYHVLREVIKHPILSKIRIVDISKGGWHTFVKTASNKILAFGNNRFSQLSLPSDGKLQDYLSTPKQVFQNNEDIWFSNLYTSRAKSSRK